MQSALEDTMRNSTEKESKNNNRRAFDFARGNLWSIDPMEICIVGGKRLPVDEQGPLDTDHGLEHDLYDERLDEALTEEFVNNVDAHGVDTPIIIAKIDDVATVVAGRKRVRAARLVNLRRKKKGEPLLKIDAKLKRVAGAGALGAMIRENEGRTDDGILTKIEKLKRLMNRGVSIEDAAIDFNVKLATVKGWLAFEDCATAETKTAARDGRLSASAAAELARIVDPDKQREKLVGMLSSGGKASTSAARAASKIARGKAAGVADKKTQKKLLHVVQASSHPNVSEKTAAWWDGAEAMLRLVIGDKDVDARLQGKLDETISLLKTEKRAKATKKAVTP
jgi:ParB-like chromosome segregation protein Spo0J